MGTSIFKWAHDSTFWRTVRKEERLQTSLDRFVTATALSSIAFHFLTQGQDIQATGISAVGYAFVTGGSPDPTKYVERVFALRKMVLSILSFSIWPHALTGHHRLDLDLAAPFRDCQLSIGLFSEVKV